MIEVRDLVKRYGDRNAVDHLSFTVEDGQIFGFLGPNGAGKTTTMNIMTGYLGRHRRSGPGGGPRHSGGAGGCQGLYRLSAGNCRRCIRT